MRSVPTSERPLVSPKCVPTLMSTKWTLDTCNLLASTALKHLGRVWIKSGTAGSTILISHREIAGNQSWIWENLHSICLLSQGQETEPGRFAVDPSQMREHSLKGTMPFRLKINKGLDILVAQLKCRLLGRAFHLTSDSNSRSKAVHYNWVSFWKIQALYIQFMGK